MSNVPPSAPIAIHGNECICFPVVVILFDSSFTPLDLFHVVPVFKPNYLADS